MNTEIKANKQERFQRKFKQMCQMREPYPHVGLGGSAEVEAAIVEVEIASQLERP